MRYSIGFMFVLAGLVALPLNVSAQDGEEGADAKSTRPAFAFIPEHLKQRLPQHRYKRAPSSEPAPEKPALELKLDEAGVEVVPTPPADSRWRRRIQITDERMDRRTKRAWIGFGVSAGVLAVGGVTILVASVQCMIGEWTESCNRIENAGIIVMSAGGAGMIASGIVLGVRKRKLRELQQADYGTPRRVQWDLSQSRLVF